MEDFGTMRSTIIAGNTYKDCWEHFNSFKKDHNIVIVTGAQQDDYGHYQMSVLYYDNKKEEDNSKYVLCDESKNIEESLTPWIDKPVYVKGYCWNKEFDGWTVLYIDEKEERDWLGHLNLYFDYKGNKYPMYGFLPSRLTMPTDSTYYNAIYSYKV